MSFVIGRIGNKKFHSLNEISSAVNHNLRLHLTHSLNERIYQDKTHNNRVLINSFNCDLKNGSSFQNKLMNFYNSKNIKIKENNVLMLEFIISASPEFFENISKKVYEDWINTQLEFIKNQFGDNAKLVVLHEDESSPHFHIFLSTDQTSIKKYKNQKGEFFKETTSLNAKRFNPDYLSQFQDNLAKANEKFKLARGIVNSDREHESIKDFNKRVKKILSKDYEKEIENQLNTLIEKNQQEIGLFNKKKVLTTSFVKKVFKPFLNRVLKDISIINFIKKESEKLQKTKEENEKLKKDLSSRSNSLHNAMEIIEKLTKAGINKENEKIKYLNEKNQELFDLDKKNKEEIKNLYEKIVILQNENRSLKKNLKSNN